MATNVNEHFEMYTRDILKSTILLENNVPDNVDFACQYPQRRKEVGK